jgi:hypothetical protein
MAKLLLKRVAFKGYQRLSSPHMLAYAMLQLQTPTCFNTLQRLLIKINVLLGRS